jgi:hypothetical protein
VRAETRTIPKDIKRYQLRSIKCPARFSGHQPRPAILRARLASVRSRLPNGEFIQTASPRSKQPIAPDAGLARVLFKLVHSYNDQASVVKFSERNWDLKPLTHRSRDNLHNPFGGSSFGAGSPAWIAAATTFFTLSK